MAKSDTTPDSKGKYSERFPGGKPLHGGDGKLNFQWDKVGQELVGTFLGMKEYSGKGDRPGKLGHIARVRELETEVVRAFSVPDHLAGMLEGVKAGTDLAIVYASQRKPSKPGQSGFKVFEVYEV